MSAVAEHLPVPRAPPSPFGLPRIAWRRWLIAKMLYGSGVDRPAKARARIGLAIVAFATVYAAIVARLFSKIGALTPGKEADIVMLATDRINVFPLNNVPGAIVTLMDTTNVENVFIAGKIRKWRGQLVGVDLARIRTQAEKSRDGLLARAKYPRDLFSSCCLT